MSVFQSVIVPILYGSGNISDNEIAINGTIAETQVAADQKGMEIDDIQITAINGSIVLLFRFERNEKIPFDLNKAKAKTDAVKNAKGK